MRVAVLTMRLYAPWVHSLKEKRMVVKSLLARIRNEYNVSVAEAGVQDVHQTIVLAVAALASNPAQADSMMDQIQRFVDRNTEAEITDIETELF